MNASKSARNFLQELLHTDVGDVPFLGYQAGDSWTYASGAFICGELR